MDILGMPAIAALIAFAEVGRVPKTHGTGDVVDVHPGGGEQAVRLL